ncbi:MAG: FHA domain-containing protein [Acidaminobacter sp.]|nr:FHA domain-containing protein [Acidaminobacter sp.]MZQ96950.1 FHA domain-containing protein [Acidaminobacter sp.]
MFELNVLTHYPERPYLIPLLREKDDDVQLVYAFHSHMTLEQWLRRTAVDYHDLLSILEETVQILAQAAKHYLRLDHFCISPSQICYHTVKKRIELIYMPTRNTEPSFEEKWQQFLNSLVPIAALSLKPEGFEAFKSLSESTVHRYERQTALVNVIRHWFASNSKPVESEMADRDDLHPYSNKPLNVINSGYETSQPLVVEQSVQTAKVKAGGKIHQIVKPKVIDSSHSNGGLIEYFKRLCKREEKSIPEKTVFSRAEIGEESHNLIRHGVSTHSKISMYRPDFEGTTLLSEQEKLQGKLVLQNQQACKIFELSKPVTRIGRNTALCDVIIDDDITIGRLHAEVHHLDQGYFLKDLDSLNGTYLNEQRLDSQTLYKLKGNDRLRLSEQEILFV